MITILRWVLLGFAIIALFVSAFLINNTFQIIVTQRVRELALPADAGLALSTGDIVRAYSAATSSMPQERQAKRGAQ